MSDLDNHFAKLTAYIVASVLSLLAVVLLVGLAMRLLVYRNDAEAQRACRAAGNRVVEDRDQWYCQKPAPVPCAEKQ